MADVAGPDPGPRLRELLDAGDPTFVDELRRVADANTLGEIARHWYVDRRPASRRLLLEYLDRPLNAYRHEALVKRLFKFAEAAGDHEVMARFLVLLDRSVRRVRATRTYHETEELRDHGEALALAERWRAQGVEDVRLSSWGEDSFYVRGRWSEPMIRTPRTTVMPRDRPIERYDPWTSRPIVTRDWVPRLKLHLHAYPGAESVPEPLRPRLEGFRLFTTRTRYYLRRRAWRYFRNLGRRHPEDYVAAVAGALLRYEEGDVADDLALLDNWGLVHILFHHSPLLTARVSVWVGPPGALDALEPAPMFEPLWKASPRTLLDLLRRGRCRPLRRWARRMIERDPAGLAGTLPLEEILALFDVGDPDVTTVAAALLLGHPGLERLEPGRWLAWLEAASPAMEDVLAVLMGRHLRPNRLTFAEALRLAAARPLALARLGLEALRGRPSHSEVERRSLLGLVEAQSEALRPEIVRWVRGVLAAASEFDRAWILEYLDSRHADVRAEGWAWFLEDSGSRDDVTLWRRLLESPHDDVRLALIAELEARTRARGPVRDLSKALDPPLLRAFWAAILLNVHRGGRAKPWAVRQVLERLAGRPDEATELLPLLSVALRSTRGPEWRSGLAAVVQLAEHDPAMLPLIRDAFPELKWG